MNRTTRDPNAAAASAATSLPRLTRRDALKGTGLLGMQLFLGGGCDASPHPVADVPKGPGLRPNPDLPEGQDTLPQIQHVIVVMMENHSFDNYFGMLETDEGFELDDGVPKATNPDHAGTPIRAFHMTSECQLQDQPSQSWNASHTALNDDAMDGFVRASGPVAMGYWDESDLPFYYGLARTFSLCTRWFGSTLCQTYPNRRFLMAATAAGIVSTNADAISAPAPPNGNIFERFDAHGISWRNYHSDVASVGLLLDYALANAEKLSPIDKYFTDAAAGTLPSFSLVDPPFSADGSEENPGDVRLGEQLVANVIKAAMQGPGWSKTLIVWLYDEHGGYYDHVTPPPAIPPDDIPPQIGPTDLPGGYDRYGFRVPAVVISPYSKPGYRSSVVRDHTSILKFVERKWNLGALSHRDANADDLLECLDFQHPAFLTPPTLPEPALAAMPPACTPGDGGSIPHAAKRMGPDEPRRARVGDPLREVWARRTGHAPRE